MHQLALIVALSTPSLLACVMPKMPFFSNCPHSWECTHEGVGNAPQKICQQEKD
jgi:hypothetical protein